MSHQLQNEFPDLKQSVIADVLQGNHNDINAASRILREIQDQEKKIQEGKIKELVEMFPNTKRKYIRRALEQNGWDVDTSIVPLFNLKEEKKVKRGKKANLASEEKRKRELEERRRQQALEQTENLKKLFTGIPPQQIQKILDENEGDIDETTTALLQIVAEQEEEKKRKADRERFEKEDRIRREQEELKQIKIKALCEKQGITTEESIAALQANNWDIKVTMTNLMNEQAKKKTDELQKAFPTLDAQKIKAVLLDNSWDVVKAADALNQMKNRAEQEKKQQENPTELNQRIQHNFLASSVLVAAKVEEDIKEISDTLRQDQKAEQDKVMVDFRKQIEDLIAAQARYGVTPGMAPPLVKQIDEIIGKKAAPVQEVQEVEAPREMEAPIKNEMSDSKPFDSSLTVELKVNPEKPDVGNAITVEWNISSSQFSTSYDWIGIFPVEGTNKQYLTYQWVGKDKKSGSVTFYAPKNYGTFEFRYFSNNSYNHITKSSKVVVGPQLDLQCTLDTKAGKVVVEWKKISGNDCAGAWIGLYEKSQTDNKKYVTWEYVNKVDNTVVFDAPVKPTLYEARFFTNSYSDITRSNSISIQGEDTISATLENGMIVIKPNIVTVDPAYSNAWVGLYFTSQTDNRQWRRYKYISDRSSNVQFKLPNTPGEYEARLFANRTYDLLLRSNKFTLPPKN